MKPSADFVHEPDPDNPGWYRWDLTDPTRFNSQAMGDLLIRSEGEDSARLRMMPERRHSNLLDGVHGGVTLSLIDIALFATVQTVLNVNGAGSVTLDVECRFIGAATTGKPLDAVTQVLRETGRMAFMRGLVEQEGSLIASYSGTIRKPSAPR